MLTKTVIVGSSIGLHARPAGAQVTVASEDEAALNAVATLVQQDLDA